MVKKSITLIVKDYIKAVKKHNIKVEAAILYGSHAKGTADEDSDIDIAIISPDFGKNKFEEGVLLKKISEEVDYDIWPEPYTLDEYRKAKEGDFLYQEIMQKGKIIPV